ncbi:hypothetical protein [Salinisphaera sp. S4-8]|uniref:hypothetical protein n=1 Tax=Salinisphaera sp. S4-8 TaxID=633357 RepID=UPI0033405C9A
MRAWTTGGLAVGAVCIGLAVSGCAHERVAVTPMADTTLDAARGPQENARLYTDLIRELIAQDRLYAALAHLQAREREFGPSDQLRLLRADILRRMGDDDTARGLYESLLDSDYAAQANHGLGLILIATDRAAGMAHLQRAVVQMPTNARMRSDFGYALLRAGEYEKARLQLATAYQLDEANELNRNNYILLLLVTGADRQAGRIAAREQLDADLMRRLREQARSLANADGVSPMRSQPRGAPAVGIGGGGG